MRKTGLRLLGDGLESNEVCVWVIAEPLIERDAWAALGDDVPALDRYRADRRIEILQSQTWYLTGDDSLCAYPRAAPRVAHVTRTHPPTIRKGREE